MADLPVRGIDLSEFNGDVDLNALKGKIGFAILRCGYGGNYPDQDDAQYENNVKKCEAVGIPYGVYLYSYARTKLMAESEAAHTLRLLWGKRPLYGVWYDVEDRTLPTGKALIDNCIAYCSAVEQAGYYCGIYASLNWWETRLNSPRLDRFDRWVAQWNNTLDYKGPCGIWQYTDSGLLDGKRFDMDLAYRDYPAIIREMEENDLTETQVRRLAQQVYEENERQFRTLESVPDWAKAAVRTVYDELKLGGVDHRDGNIVLNGSYTYLRALYVAAEILKRFDPLLTGEKTAEAEERMVPASAVETTDEETADDSAQVQPL